MPQCLLHTIHNILIMLLKLSGVQIGERTWILVNLLRQAGFKPGKLKIGKSCVICANTVFLCGDGYRLLLKRRREEGRQDGSDRRQDGSDKQRSSVPHDGIIINDNCFIGLGAIIMNGVSIGPNSIVGAGAVVFNDVPPDTCVAGNPGRFICSLEAYTKAAWSMAIEGYNEISMLGINKRDFLTGHFWKRE